MISILIRNKNEALLLEKTLQGISNQKNDVPHEVVMIDDNSIDNSLEVAHRFGCKIVLLDKKFSYGCALNFGLLHCKYDIVLMLSSHNILLSNDFFIKLEGYFSDQYVAGVRCTPVANIKQVEQSLVKPIIIDSENFDQNRDWSNLLIANCSAIRKSIALKIKFNEKIRSNEDKLWSLDVIKAGYSIVSNVQCYYLYNKKGHPAAEIRDAISKYQIDGDIPLKFSKFCILFLKSFPWIIKIAFKKWLDNFIRICNLVQIKYKFKKHDYI